MKKTIASLQASPTAILTRLFSRFMRSSFPFPSPSDACHAGYKTQRQMFLLVSGRHIGAHPDGHQHGVSIQISINLGKTFIHTSSIYEKLLWPKSWREPLHIYLLSFLIFWTLYYERFWFLFLYIPEWRDTEPSNITFSFRKHQANVLFTVHFLYLRPC